MFCKLLQVHFKRHTGDPYTSLRCFIEFREDWVRESRIHCPDLEWEVFSPEKQSVIVHYGSVSHWSWFHIDALGCSLRCGHKHWNWTLHSWCLVVALPCCCKKYQLSQKWVQEWKIWFSEWIPSIDLFESSFKNFYLYVSIF